MADGAIEQVLRRDRLIVLTSIGVIIALAWAYLLWLEQQPMQMSVSSEMAGMDMSTPGMVTPVAKAWSVTEFIFLFVMWTVMMVGMMTPSVAPMVLLHATVGRRAEAQGKPLAATAWFAGGYLLCWTLFAFAAALLQSVLDHAVALTPQMALASRIGAGVTLIAAGVYQWLPVKDICLSRCRSPLSFMQHHGGFQKSGAGALKLGMQHGFYCIGCCAALMALLFVGGVMNVLWIAGLSILVLAEKILPAGKLIARVAGALLAIGGIALLAREFWPAAV